MFQSKQHKLFRDPVHGYIAVPNDYCKYIIDTPEFQRLRRIEQTSMRVLFPGAHHDRFIHSLGVFHLGNQAVDFIERNSEEIIKSAAEAGDFDWQGLRKTFEIACLLHDIGHSPFSHTFEKYYDFPRTTLENRLSSLVADKDSEFKEEIKNNISNPHEKCSAILVVTKFSEAIVRLGADPVLAARMIIGLHYKGSGLSNKAKFSNCLIDLLNGHAIDVDRLDYASRDRWATGYNAGSFDINRILSSISICSLSNEKLKLVFHKSSLSEITSVIGARNFQNFWIFSHHKVVYDQYVLVKSIEKLAEILTGEQEGKALAKIFCIDSFFEPQKIGDFDLYLPTDDDITFLLKSKRSEIGVAKEWLYREHKLKPLWKSYAEFYSVFGHLSEKCLKDGGSLRGSVDAVLKNEYEASEGLDYYVYDKQLGFKQIKNEDIFIRINDKIVDYDNLNIPFDNNLKPAPFFFLYVNDDLLSKQTEIIKKLEAFADS